LLNEVDSKKSLLSEILTVYWAIIFTGNLGPEKPNLFRTNYPLLKFIEEENKKIDLNKRF